MKHKVCAGCGKSIVGSVIKAGTLPRGTKICLICGSTKFKEIDLPETLSCRYCKIVSTVEDLFKQWKQIPFLDINDNTYYCGCRGWE